MAQEPLIAVFIDYENLAIGARDMKRKFQVDLIIKRLLEKGRIVYKRAYCDWSAYRSAEHDMHTLGIELMDIPRSKISGKNSADIRMVVDALDLCYSKDHIDTFALISGDSDFSPLVSKLKENHKRVVGCGIKSSTSDLLIANCDEFIYYDDLVRSRKKSSSKKKTSRKKDKKAEAMELAAETVQALEGDYDPVWGSLIKQTLRRVQPGFNESYYGYRNFNDLLEEAAKRGLLHIDYDESRGNYKVRTVD